MKRLTGKIALVVGGSRGIGTGIVRKLASEGALVAFTYVNAISVATALENELIAYGDRAFAIKADVAVAGQMTTAISKTQDHYGPIDILVNNAGLFVAASINDPDPDSPAILRMWEVNVKGVVRTVSAVARQMKPGGRIITIGSGAAARTPFAGVADYAATKAALAAYTRGWARDLADRRITVNIVQPGLIDTDLKPDNEDAINSLLQPVALGRFGTPAEVGSMVAFLASDEASYVTGATINVDGGWSA
ncbi:MAG: short-chain dehydrogenase/reductase [Mucilaginibacter sp.]|nr:short-chain dehydrogenase/reductase [Mucilaginibacter sp.]